METLRWPLAGEAVFCGRRLGRPQAGDPPCSIDGIAGKACGVAKFGEKMQGTQKTAAAPDCW